LPCSSCQTALWRRKHTAWLLALVVLIISSISFLIEGLNFVAVCWQPGCLWLLAVMVIPAAPTRHQYARV